MHKFNIHPQSVKTIKAVHFDTGWKPEIKTKTTSNADKAIEDVNMFTNGSGMEEKIGVAAVLYRNGRAKTILCYQLGLQRHHMVYKGEGVGVILGTKLISKLLSWLHN